MKDPCLSLIFNRSCSLPDESTLWESKIRLGEDFFNEVIRHPVPLDMNTSRPSNAPRWVSISTCGWSTAPSRSRRRQK